MLTDELLGEVRDRTGAAWLLYARTHMHSPVWGAPPIDGVKTSECHNPARSRVLFLETRYF